MAESSSDHDDEEHQEPPPPPPPRRRGRGPTKLAQVLSQPAERHERNHLDLDEYDRPMRPTAKPFSSFIGTLARNRINIAINEWKDVDDKDKKQCWRDILVILICVSITVKYS